MSPLFQNSRLLLILLTLSLPLGLSGKEEELSVGGTVFELEPFVIYEAEIDVIDGHTGKKYTGDNDVVLDFADMFNELLLKYHERLLVFEIRHLNMRLETGKAFVNDLNLLAESFGIDGFKVDHNSWLTKEIAIVHRLNKDPFFKIEALVAWDLDTLNAALPARPTSKLARDIRYNDATGQWERRVTTEWKVSFMQNPTNRNRYGTPVNILKQQGLNLDTNEGYHIIDRGLNNNVFPDAFKEVKLTYPILVSSTEPHEEQVKRLQDTFVQNLYHIYDPFSWVARRNTRFRGGFVRELESEVRAERMPYISDRKWFDPVLSRFLSDVITIKYYGTKEIYSLFAYQRFELSKNVLGKDLDLLNWHPDEKRKGEPKPQGVKIRINYKNSGSARWILLDAYMRYTDKFVDALRTKLETLKTKTNGQTVIQKTIEDVSGAPFDVYMKQAIKDQTRMIEKYRPQEG